MTMRSIFLLVSMGLLFQVNFGTWCTGRSAETGVTGVEEALEMLQEIISKGYYLARRDTVREPSSFSSRMSSVMRRLYVRACEKTMLSLHLGEWLIWKCKSAAHSVDFLLMAMGSLRSGLMWIFMYRKDISWMECWKVNLILGWLSSTMGLTRERRRWCFFCGNP